jgi:hypothetical protein
MVFAEMMKDVCHGAREIEGMKIASFKLNYVCYPDMMDKLLRDLAAVSGVYAVAALLLDDFGLPEEILSNGKGLRAKHQLVATVLKHVGSGIKNFQRDERAGNPEGTESPCPSFNNDI